MHRLEPIEGVVHDGVHVSRDGIFASQLPDGALHAFRVEVKIVVHQVRLNGIAAPCPSVALDAVHEELACGELKCVGTDLPDDVQFDVAAAERSAFRLVEGRVFVVHGHLVVACAIGCFYIDKPESLAVQAEDACILTLVVAFQHVERLAMFLVESFLAALTVIDAGRSAAESDELQASEGLTAEVVKHSVGYLFLADRLLFFVVQVVARRRSVAAVEVPRPHRHVNTGAVGHAVLVDPYLVFIRRRPRSIAHDGLPFDKQRRGRGLVPHFEAQRVLTFGNGQCGLRRPQHPVHGNVPFPFGADVDGFVGFQLHRLRELHRGPVGVLLPERRKHGSPLRPAVVEDVA